MAAAKVASPACDALMVTVPAAVPESVIVSPETEAIVPPVTTVYVTGNPDSATALNVNGEAFTNLVGMDGKVIN